MTTRKVSRSRAVKGAAPSPVLVDDIRRLISEARLHVATTANATLTLVRRTCAA